MLSISIILHGYNNSENLSLAIDSILDQDLEDIDLHIVLVDNCSTDTERTATKLKDISMYLTQLNIPSNILSLIKHEDLLIANLYAAKFAKNEYLLFLEGSQYFMPGFFQKLKRIITTFYSSFGCVLSDTIIVNGKTLEYITYSPLIWQGRELKACEESIQLSDFLGLCVRKDLIKNLDLNDIASMYKSLITYKIGYTSINAGVLVIGESIDSNKRKNIHNELYNRSS